MPKPVPPAPKTPRKWFELRIGSWYVCADSPPTRTLWTLLGGAGMSLLGWYLSKR